MSSHAGPTRKRTSTALCPSSSTWDWNRLLFQWPGPVGPHLVFTCSFNLETLILKSSTSTPWASPEGAGFHSNRLTHRAFVVSRELPGCWMLAYPLCSACSACIAEPCSGPVLTFCGHRDPELWAERPGVLCLFISGASVSRPPAAK